MAGSFWGPDAPTAIDCATAVGNCTVRVVAAADPIRLVEVPLGFASLAAPPRFTG